MATFVQQLLPRAPDNEWPDAIRLLSQPQSRTSEGTPLDARDTDRNPNVWHAKLVLATTGLHLAQFRHKHRPLAKAVDYAGIFIYDEAQQEAALSDLAILGALPRKCLILRLGDPKQTSGGTGPSDLARKVRLISDQLALGIRAFCKPYLPQLLLKLLQSLLLDDLLPGIVSVVPEHQHTVDADTVSATEAPPGGGKPAAAVPLSAARVPLARVLPHIVGELPLRWHTAGDLDACAGERAPHDWYVMLPVSQRVQPGVYTLMALSRYRDALIQSCGSERPVVYQPLIPQILIASYHCILLPPRAFDAHPPVTRDVFYAVALLLQLRTHYPELVMQHRGAQARFSFPQGWTRKPPFAKLFADIGRKDDVRYVQIDELLKNGLPPPSAVNSRHVQALQICNLKPSPMLQGSRLTLPS